MREAYAQCSQTGRSVEVTCRVPDDYLLKSKRPLLMGREVLAAVVAGYKAREFPC